MRVQDEKKKWRREEEKKYIEKWLVRSAMALVAVLDWCIERRKQHSYSVASYLLLLIPNARTFSPIARFVRITGMAAEGNGANIYARSLVGVKFEGCLFQT